MYLPFNFTRCKDTQIHNLFSNHTSDILIFYRKPQDLWKFLWKTLIYYFRMSLLIKRICKQNLANSQKYFMKCPLTNSIPEVWCLKNAACLAPMQNLHHNGANFLNWGGARDLISLLWHNVAKNIICLCVYVKNSLWHLQWMTKKICLP